MSKNLFCRIELTLQGILVVVLFLSFVQGRAGRWIHDHVWGKLIDWVILGIFLIQSLLAIVALVLGWA